MTLLLPLVLKYLAESAWCARGLKLEGPTGPGGALAAWRYGLVRLLIGRGVMLTVSALHPPVTELTLYLFLLGIRWPIWSLMAALVARRRVRPATLLGSGTRSRAWQAGGVFLSCAADLPAILFGSWVGELWA